MKKIIQAITLLKYSRVMKKANRERRRHVVATKQHREKKYDL